MRIRSLEPDPLHSFVMMLTSPVTKLINRVEIGEQTLVQYDLKNDKVVRTILWPNDVASYGANIQFAPDGKLMYLFIDQAVHIYDTNTFAQVDKWDISLANKVLYIYTAGNTIDLWDAETYQYLRSITLDGDATTALFVLPIPPTSTPAPSAQ